MIPGGTLHSVDEDVIGGFVLTIEDMQYDASVASSLRKLKNNYFKPVLKRNSICLRLNLPKYRKFLKKQIEGFKSGVELEEVGTVLQVGDGIARIYGLNNVQANELIEFDSGVMGIVLNLEEDNVGAVLLGSSELIKEGDSVKRTKKIASIDVGESIAGTGDQYPG